MLRFVVTLNFFVILLRKPVGSLFGNCNLDVLLPKKPIQQSFLDFRISVLTQNKWKLFFFLTSSALFSL
jgi:hypothetical protein